MATVAVVLRESGDAYYIHLRVTHQRKSVFISLGKRTEPVHFKPAVNSWVSRHHPDAVFINTLIEEKRRVAMKYITDCEINNEPISLEYVSALVKGRVKDTSPAGVSFLKAIEDRSLFHFANNKPGSYYKYKRLRVDAEEAWGRDYSPAQLTKKEVETYMLHRKGRGIHDNTIRKELSFLATVFKTVCNTGNPFKEIKIVPVPTRKEKLTKDEIVKIEGVKLFGFAEVAKDMFLFSYYTQGMRFQNVALMPSNCLKNGSLIYQMNKGQKHRELEAHPKLVDIIMKYKGKSVLLFPVVKKIPKDAWEIKDKVGSADSLVNEHLKIVAAAACISKNLTFHMARHAFSYNALKHGVSYPVLKDALGHSDYKTTQKYLDSLSDDHINNAVRGMYD